jgi:hypothetical protein
MPGPKNSDRFLAPPPVMIPKGATRAERIRLRYGAFGPPKGSRDAARVAVSSGDRKGMSSFLRTMPRK